MRFFSVWSANPQIQRVRSSRGRTRMVSKILLSWIFPFFKCSIVILSDTNTMICSSTATSSSPKHHHWTIATTPLTPEPNAVASLDVATTVRLAKPCRGTIRTTKIHWTASKTSVIRPDVTIVEPSITGQKPSQGSVAQAIRVSTEKGRVWAIVASSDLNVISFYFPKRFRYHIVVTWSAGSRALWRLLVIPPVSIISHPDFRISVRKPSSERPATSRHVTINLSNNVYISKCKLNCLRDFIFTLLLFSL